MSLIRRQFLAQGAIGLLAACTRNSGTDTLYVGDQRGGQKVVLAALEAQGKPLDAVTFAFLTPHDGEAALKSGAVDAWAIWDPNATLAVQNGARIVEGSVGLAPSYTLQFVSDKAIAAKRPLLSDYSERLYRGWQWAIDHGDTYARMLERETGLAFDIWQEVGRKTRRVPVPITAELIADQQKTADRYYRAGLLAHPLQVTHAFDKSFHP